MKKIKVLLSSQPKLYAEVIRNLIAHQPDMEVVGELLSDGWSHKSRRLAVGE